MLCYVMFVMYVYLANAAEQVSVMHGLSTLDGTAGQAPDAVVR
jgi:hypothetical protein